MSKLFVVGTPIGNLQDITLRAIETLKNVDIIACEDTRNTKKLLAHFNILGKKLLSYHDKNEKNSTRGLLKLLKLGKKIAIVSDAGMPVINDPGFEIIRQVIKNKIDFEIIPGISAITTTIVLSNFDVYFKFLGFLNAKTGKRINQLKKLSKGTYIAFISPHKIINTLEDIKNTLGEDTRVFLGKELTKKFETHYRGTINKVINQIKQKEQKIKGEFTIAIEIKNKIAILNNE